MTRWIEGFATNQVCYDSYAKEFVKISNGECTLDHSNPAAFKASHGDGACIYAPSEAVALRCVGVHPNGDPIVAFTYRKVDPKMLKSAKDTDFPALDRFRPSRFIGRI